MIRKKNCKAQTDTRTNLWGIIANLRNPSMSEKACRTTGQKPANHRPFTKIRPFKASQTITAGSLSTWEKQCFRSEKPAGARKKSETARWPGKALSLHRHCCAREARDLSRGKRATPECEKNNGYHEFIRRPIVLQQFLTRTTGVLNRPRPPSKVVTSCLT